MAIDMAALNATNGVFVGKLALTPFHLYSSCLQQLFDIEIEVIFAVLLLQCCGRCYGVDFCVIF